MSLAFASFLCTCTTPYGHHSSTSTAPQTSPSTLRTSPDSCVKVPSSVFVVGDKRPVVGCPL